VDRNVYQVLTKRPGQLATTPAGVTAPAQHPHTSGSGLALRTNTSSIASTSSAGRRLGSGFCHANRSSDRSARYPSRALVG
jgi:hypothetical protein